MVSVTSNLTGCLYELLTFFFGNIVCPQEVKKNPCFSLCLYLWLCRLQETLGNDVKVYLLHCWGLVNTVLQPVKCQHPFSVSVRQSSWCRWCEPSSQSIQKVRERGGGEKGICVPSGGSWMRLDLASTLSCWSEGICLKQKNLTCIFEPFVETAVWEKRSANMKGEKETKNIVFQEIPHNPPYLDNRLNLGKSFTLQGYVCFLLLFLVFIHTAFDPQPCPPQSDYLSIFVVH